MCMLISKASRWLSSFWNLKHEIWNDHLYEEIKFHIQMVIDIKFEIFNNNHHHPGSLFMEMGLCAVWHIVLKARLSVWSNFYDWWTTWHQSFVELSLVLWWRWLAGDCILCNLVSYFVTCLDFPDYAIRARAKL